MKNRRLVFFLAGFGVITLARAADSIPSPHADESSFVFEQGGLHVLVRSYVPGGVTANSPVVFVMPGFDRNGDVYLDDWIPYARQRRFVLVVPEFSNREFPGARSYQDGNIVTSTGRPVPRLQWTYSMIEPIFDEVRQRSHNHTERYFIYGHSAGAQFVERFICFVPQARIARAVIANAGSYMLPATDRLFPYGFAGTGLGEQDLRAALALPLVVLLGTADTDPNHKDLPRAPEAEAQGSYRLARGKYFFNLGATAAAALRTPFGWQISFAPGVAHSNRKMAPFAVKCLFPEK